ncbi:MAG: UDP-N-acetylglucosamine--N-acetylmuramyl-(pentapeptide) pyrophosphoryl-undecaprenol N-acetylglucosamine transferase [Planctomycetes bacterium]|nr:UDP-N-acetylglucosamine--N-acetylmuramyl-(pentapeptide) pyrophosphoryl-undecaprenol N-acetylglucosamine transferase [Planctomycetota bacterium]
MTTATSTPPRADRSRPKTVRIGITESLLPEAACLPTFSTDAWSRSLTAPGAAFPATRVLFAGGGTGGHLYPAAAIAGQLGDLAPGSEVLFAGSDRRLEQRILAGCGYAHRVLPTAPWRGIRGAFGFALGQVRGLLAARQLLREFQPHVVVGLGGFPSVGPALAASMARIPLVLFEPNASAGKANLFLARLAREAYVHFPETQLHCPRISSGTPLDGRVLLPETSQGEARRLLGLPGEGKLILVMGGSQGSRAINAWLERSLSAERGQARGVTFLHLAGDEAQAVRLRAAYSLAGVSHRVLDYLAGIGVAYRAADLALVRGGGATLAELSAAGLPACVVPLPNSAGDHQRHNARSFAATGGGWVEEEAELGPESWRLLLERVHSEELLDRAGAILHAGARPDAADVVARRVISIAHGLELTGRGSR